jgi:Sulfotransferase domain
MPPAVPQRPADWQTGPPDFIGVGVQRCGTTRWFDLMSAHPEVAGSEGAKELHYFDRFFTGGCTQEDLARYHEYFPRRPGTRAGEWTPLYASAPWVPPLLAAAAPDARLLMLLRDPVERYLSGLQLDTRRARRRASPLRQFMRGLYHSQLLGLLRHFDRSQILILQYERCTLEPEGQLRRTFEFIGVKDTKFVPELGARPQHQPHKPALDDETRRAYVQSYEDEVARLAESFSEIDLSLWPNFTHMSG